MPYSLEMARTRLAEQARPRPASPRAHWIQLGVELDGELIGDLACHLARRRPASPRSATRSAPRSTGTGTPREAAGALVDHLLATTEVHRIEASLDPRERRVDARARSPSACSSRRCRGRATAIRGGWDDDLRYAMLRDDRAAWLARPTHSPGGRGTGGDHAGRRVPVGPAAHPPLAGAVRVHHGAVVPRRPVPRRRRRRTRRAVDARRAGRRRARGVRDARRGHRPPPRAVPVAAAGRSHAPAPRHRHDDHRSRAGRAHRGRGTAPLVTSWHEGPGGTAPFYERLGFVPTGRLVDDEVEARLSW